MLTPLNLKISTRLIIALVIITLSFTLSCYDLYLDYK